MSRQTKYLVVVYRNLFARLLRFWLPKMIAVKFMVRGVPSISMFDIGNPYKVKLRHVEFAYGWQGVFFKIKSHNGKGLEGGQKQKNKQVPAGKQATNPQ